MISLGSLMKLMPKTPAHKINEAICDLIKKGLLECCYDKNGNMLFKLTDEGEKIGYLLDYEDEIMGQNKP